VLSRDSYVSLILEKNGFIVLKTGSKVEKDGFKTEWLTFFVRAEK